MVSTDEAECAALTLLDAGSEAAAGSSQGEGESVARSSYGRVPLELNGRVGKGARRTFYTISASLTARAVPTRQW